MKTYKVTVQRIVVQEFSCEVEAESEEKAEAEAFAESERACTADWSNVTWDTCDETRVELLRDDGEDEEDASALWPNGRCRCGKFERDCDC